MAWKAPNYKQIAELEEMDIDVFANNISIMVMAAVAIAMLCVAYISVDTLSPEQLEQLTPYITG
jgi:hypothetical protein